MSKAVVWAGTDHEQTLTRRVSYFGPLHSGDRVVVSTTGGGGWGNPSERDPALVRDDVRNGFLTPEQALEQYGLKV